MQRVLLTNGYTIMRKVIELIRAQATSDGAGVKLLRVFGGPRAERFDPFLMLDEFGSYDADDYIAGFPPHPHRGFETITYMLEGKMEHRDHMQNVGLLNDGDVQWMTAARGIIHSEMPKQTAGRMRGFQFWLNLPAAKKMNPAHYHDVAASEIPIFELDGVWVKAIAGVGQLNGATVQGRFNMADTQPLIWDVHLPGGIRVNIELSAILNALIYVYEGSVLVGGSAVQAQHLARLSGDGELVVESAGGASKILVIAGKPLGEPIAQYGPFVMNTDAEIEQALSDYRNGVLTD